MTKVSAWHGLVAAGGCCELRNDLWPRDQQAGLHRSVMAGNGSGLGPWRAEFGGAPSHHPGGNEPVSRRDVAVSRWAAVAGDPLFLSGGSRMPVHHFAPLRAGHRGQRKGRKSRSCCALHPFPVPFQAAPGRAPLTQPSPFGSPDKWSTGTCWCPRVDGTRHRRPIGRHHRFGGGQRGQAVMSTDGIR